MHGGKNDVRIAVGSAFRHRHRPDGELGLGKGSSQQLLHVGGRETRAREQLPAYNVAVGVAESGDEEHAAALINFHLFFGDVVSTDEIVASYASARRVAAE